MPASYVAVFVVVWTDFDGVTELHDGTVRILLGVVAVLGSVLCQETACLIGFSLPLSIYSGLYRGYS